MQQIASEFYGKRQLLQVLPFQNDQGLDRLIVTIVPKLDFIDQINVHTLITLLLYVAILLIAVAAIITACWITKPLLSLEIAAKSKWDKTLEIKHFEQMGQLAKLYNSKAEQKQESFDVLKESEDRLSRFLEALPVGVAVCDVSEKITYFNPTAKQILGMDISPDTTIEQLAKTYQLYRSET